MVIDQSAGRQEEIKERDGEGLEREKRMVEEEEERLVQSRRETRGKEYLLHRETIRSGKRHQERERERERERESEHLYCTEYVQKRG